MDVIVLTVILTTLLGAPAGIILSLAVAVIAAAVRSHGNVRVRALEVLKTRFVWVSLAFSLAALVLEDWQGVAIVWLIATFGINAWRRHGTSTDSDRAGLVARFLVALSGLTLAWATWNWVTTPTVAWFVGVALLAGAVFGMALRWSALPWFSETFSRVRALGLAASLAMCTLIIAVPSALA